MHCSLPMECSIVSAGMQVCQQNTLLTKIKVTLLFDHSSNMVCPVDQLLLES